MNERGRVRGRERERKRMKVVGIIIEYVREFAFNVLAFLEVHIRMHF